PRPPRDPPPRPPQQPEQATSRLPALGQKRRERAERDRRGRPRPSHLGVSEPQLGRGLSRLGGQPGLAHTGRPGQHERNRLTPRQLGEDPVQLGLPAQQRDLATKRRSHHRQLPTLRHPPPPPPRPPPPPPP